MYYRDHEPPHFHAIYGEHEALVAVEYGEALRGSLPQGAARLVKNWTMARQSQLQDNWQRAKRGELLETIAGLDAD